MFHKHEENLEGLVLELDAQAVFAQLGFLRTNFEHSEADNLRFFGGHGHGKVSNPNASAQTIM